LFHGKEVSKTNILERTNMFMCVETIAASPTPAPIRITDDFSKAVIADSEYYADRDQVHETFFSATDLIQLLKEEKSDSILDNDESYYESNENNQKLNISQLITVKTEPCQVDLICDVKKANEKIKSCQKLIKKEYGMRNSCKADEKIFRTSKLSNVKLLKRCRINVKKVNVLIRSCRVDIESLRSDRSKRLKTKAPGIAVEKLRTAKLKPCRVIVRKVKVLFKSCWVNLKRLQPQKCLREREGKRLRSDLTERYNGIKASRSAKNSCSFCFRKFSNHFHLARHTNAIHRKVRHICDQCGKSYAYKEILKAHKESKHEGKTYPCMKCSFLGSSRQSLYVHRNSNTACPSGARRKMK